MQVWRSTNYRPFLAPDRPRYRMGRTDHAKLATQTLTIVHERKNKTGRVPITKLTNYHVPAGDKPHEIPERDEDRDVRLEYPWQCLLKLLEDDFGFNGKVDYVVLDGVEIRPDINPHSPVTALYAQINSEDHWVDLLWNMANGVLRIREYADIDLLIKTRETVPEVTPAERDRHKELLARRWADDDDSSGSEFGIEPDPDAPSPPPFDWRDPKHQIPQKDIYYYRYMERFTKGNIPPPWPPIEEDFDEEDVENDLIATSPEESEASEAESESDQDAGKPKGKKPVVPGGSKLPKAPPSGPAAPDAKKLAVPRANQRAAAVRDQSPAAIKLQLIEDRAKYDTEDAQDDNYGAIDQTVIDTYVGAYNTGDSDRAWDTCLSFFNIDPDAWARQEELRDKTAAKTGAARKRVPMKKLPGMTVGLFDYQLIGVLNLLRNVLWNVPGGLLADEQGLGKTQEMFGVIALAYNLRRSKAEVKAEWKSGKAKQHNPQQRGDDTPRQCKTDERWGFRCYCYNGLTQMLADALPEGPNFIIGPERSAQQIFREGKTKLDTKVLKLRLEHEKASAEERLSSKETKALTGKITATADGFEYKANTGQSDFVIISHPSQLGKLTQTAFGVNVKAADGKVVKKSAFLPGLVLMDEFHEYTSAAPASQETRTIAWLKHLKDNHPPLVYFVSGTPFGDSPADIRSAIELFDNPKFKSGINERMAGTTVADFDKLIATFDGLLARQNGGEALPLEELAGYRKQLNRFLGCMMVRRLGVDKFRGRNLTDTGPLSVKITDHPAPPSLIESLQSLSNTTRELVNSKLPEGTTIGNFLRSQTGADLLLKLRLASTFPGISTPVDQEFTFTPSEIAKHLAKANGDLTKTPYYQHIPTFSAFSPKITTILNTVNTMMADKSKIPGESTSIKKLIIFSPLEAESMLIYGYLLLRKLKNKEIKPVWINSVHMDQPARQKVIDKFLTLGHAPPNILVAPMSLAGTGLNLQKAKYSIVTSPAWSKRDNQQAYYRVHRVGQTQETKLSLLTGRWNPADRVLLKKYEGLPVQGAEEEIWGVGDEFAKGKEGDGGGFVDRHQQVKDEAK